MDKYYREQLQRLREGAGEFARRYPAIAPMLLQESGDPDVERILEGTAWLCAKIHERLDQTAPGLVQSLLRLVFPQAILPVPSATLMRFAAKPDKVSETDLLEWEHGPALKLRKNALALDLKPFEILTLRAEFRKK